MDQKRLVARLVHLLSAYAAYDPELGYAQGWVGAGIRAGVGGGEHAQGSGGGVGWGVAENWIAYAETSEYSFESARIPWVGRGLGHSATYGQNALRAITSSLSDHYNCFSCNTLQFIYPLLIGWRYIYLGSL